MVTANGTRYITSTSSVRRSFDVRCLKTQHRLNTCFAVSTPAVSTPLSGQVLASTNADRRLNVKSETLGVAWGL